MSSSRTLSEQILSHASGCDARAGDLVIVTVDRCMSHDSLTPEMIDVLSETLHVGRIPYPERMAVFIDHVAPAATVPTANAQVKIRRWVEDQGISRFYDSGAGVCHQLMIEEGLVSPGQVVFGLDSHTNSYGAVGAFGTGVGSRDMALTLATGQNWLRVPETIQVRVKGRFRPWVNPKDLSLHLCGLLGIDGATYQAVEFHGVDWMGLEGRQTLASMSTELGAKAGIIPPTGLPGLAVPAWLRVEEGAPYARTVDVDLEALPSLVAVPFTVENVHPAAEVSGVRVHQVFLGTCTNARLSDLRAAARLLKGQRVARGVRMLVVPASHRILQDAVADGTLATLLEAGATVGTPGCGPCIGRHMGVIGEGEVCLSTANRNFRGRMGSTDGLIYLGSPETAAATALTGYITDPATLGIPMAE